ncbi:MAG: ABC transporter substrate-binding protein [Pacificimonas sp.]|jgi:phospholipid transport system substrate-binding protein|nr:ABC transporter substrate-binding protein [Pacificimonas sp.]
MSPRILSILLASMAAPAALVAAAPAYAQAASDADAARAGEFIDGLANQAFQVVRSGSANSDATKTELRALLAENFDVSYIGQYLIRRHRGDVDQGQFRAYMQVFPSWVVETYTNNLFAFKDSDLRIIRAVPAGSRGQVEVYSRVTSPSSAPIDAVWLLSPDGNGWKIRNLTVSGVNMAITQEQDFNAYINKNGFDALVDLMKRRVS